MGNEWLTQQTNKTCKHNGESFYCFHSGCKQDDEHNNYKSISSTIVCNFVEREKEREKKRRTQHDTEPVLKHDSLE